VKALASLAQEAGALVYVDAVQFASHRLIDVKDLGVDFLACSPYKYFGPHLGVVYGRRDLLESLHAYKLRCASDDLPYRFSVGTPAFELIAGLLGTLEYFQWLAGLLGVTGSRRELFSAAYSAMGEYEDHFVLTVAGGFAVDTRLAASRLEILGESRRDLFVYPR
jgi:selenocysteine lyase/cysteine desulfurase